MASFAEFLVHFLGKILIRLVYRIRIIGVENKKVSIPLVVGGKQVVLDAVNAVELVPVSKIEPVILIFVEIQRLLVGENTTDA